MAVCNRVRRVLSCAVEEEAIKKPEPYPGPGLQSSYKLCENYLSSVIVFESE